MFVKHEIIIMTQVRHIWCQIPLTFYLKEQFVCVFVCVCVCVCVCVFVCVCVCVIVFCVVFLIILWRINKGVTIISSILSRINVWSKMANKNLCSEIGSRISNIKLVPRLLRRSLPWNLRKVILVVEGSRKTFDASTGLQEKMCCCHVWRDVNA